MSARRYLRFSLKTFLAAVTIVALLIGWKITQVRRQESAVAALVEIGGQFTYEHQIVARTAPSGRVSQIDFDLPIPGPQWLQKHLGIHYFVSPVQLIVRRGGEITPEAMQRLADLQHLEELVVYQEDLSREPTTHLPLMASVQSLRIEPSIVASKNKNVRDFSFLRRFPRLRELALPFSLFQNSDGVHLSSTTTLERLDLSYTDLGDAGLSKLKLDSIVWLNIAGTNVSDIGLSHLSSLLSLEYLNLSSTPISDAGLAKLEALSQLRSLELIRTAITDDAAGHLSRIPTLARLDVVATKISDRGIDKIQEALPNCKIRVDWGRWVNKQ